jgi:branched-chain amino acid transport system permease protein
VQIIQHGIDALSLGGIYALAALGIALVFGLMQLINFAHDQILVVGAYAIWFLRVGWGLNWFVVALGLVGSVVLLAVVMERVAFRPLRGASQPVLLASSFALSILLLNLLELFIGNNFRSVAAPQQLIGTIRVGELAISRLALITLGMSALIILCLAVFLKRTSIGVQMLAASEDFEMARMLGVRANRVIATAFAISGLLGGALSFILVVQQGVIHIRMGLPLLLIGFIAVVIGGMGSLSGAVVGGVVLGVTTTVLQVALPPDLVRFRDAFLYVIVIFILLLRPQGIMGSQVRMQV